MLNGTHTYAYDGDGNRLTDSTGTAANDFRYVWDPNFSLPQVAIERDGNDTFLRNYVYGVGRLAQSTSSTNAFYYLTDSIGSTANLVKHDGGIKWTYTYEPFGAQRSATSGASAPNNFMRFAGERIDANGDFYNLRARMYDPSVGRFFQEDAMAAPIQLAYHASYGYVRARPTVATDPSGLWCLISNSSGGCLGAGLLADVASTVRAIQNAPLTIAALAWAVGNGADCGFASGGTVVCTGANSWATGPLTTVTIGNTIITENQTLGREEFGHELRHTTQWSIFGFDFVPLYYGAGLFSWLLTGHFACANPFEVDAGLQSGHYTECLSMVSK